MPVDTLQTFHLSGSLSLQIRTIVFFLTDRMPIFDCFNGELLRSSLFKCKNVVVFKRTQMVTFVAYIMHTQCYEYSNLQYTTQPYYNPILTPRVCTCVCVFEINLK